MDMINLKKDLSTIPSNRLPGLIERYSERKRSKWSKNTVQNEKLNLTMI